MKIIISPAKKMNVDRDSFPVRGLPRFLERTERLCHALQAMDAAELKALWKCNDAIVKQNVERLAGMELRRGLTPAILAYEGIQYRYMAPGVLTGPELDWLEEHLRILSGFYGVLRPMDGVTPYRLEMQAKLGVDGCRDLYDFWGDGLAACLFDETDCVVNLASREYSRCVTEFVPAGKRVVTCVFGELREGKILEKGTLCKMARGEMVRFAAELQAHTPEELRAFDRLGYRFAPAHSQADTYVFLKEV